MFNVTILKLRDIIKGFAGIIIILFLIILISNNSKIKQSNNKLLSKLEEKYNVFSEKHMIECIEKTIPSAKELNGEYKEIKNNEDKEDFTEEKFLETVLKTEISSIKSIQNQEKNNKEETDNKEFEDKELQKKEESKKTSGEQNQEQNIQLAETGIKTEVITQNPLKDSYNVEYGKVKIKNQTEYNLTEEMLNPDIAIENKNIILFHTHSCESYTSSEKYPYTPTGTFRTTDLNFSVARVGEELTKQLKEYGYNVVHNTDYHDYPSYNGSYTRSLATVENILKETPSDIIIDIHRDAIGSRSDYAPIVKIGDNDIAAQIMFVIGTDEGGLWHPNWNQNLKFAIKVQEKAEEMYPGLFKPIMLTKSRYNQHTGKYASIIEVGATGNTLEQCITSMKYLAKVISELP